MSNTFSKVVKIPFRFDKLDVLQKQKVREVLETYGSVSQSVDIGDYTNFYLLMNFNQEYQLEHTAEDRTKGTSINEVKDCLNFLFTLHGYKVY